MEYLYTHYDDEMGGDHWTAWRVVKITAKRVIVTGTDAGPLAYQEQEYHLDKAKLEADGDVYHRPSRRSFYTLEGTFRTSSGCRTYSYGGTELVGYPPPPEIPVEWHIKQGQLRKKHLAVLRKLNPFWRKREEVSVIPALIQAGFLKPEALGNALGDTTLEEAQAAVRWWGNYKRERRKQNFELKHERYLEENPDSDCWRKSNYEKWLEWHARQKEEFAA